MKNIYTRFSSETKMAEMILQNYTLLSVLPRFNIRLGFGDKCVSTACQEVGADENFFLTVCNLHTFEGYRLSEEELQSTNMRSIVAYLKGSHDYYLNYRIAAIETKLEAMGTCCEAKHHKMIKSFFKEYKEEIIKHFNYEEQIVFPYVYQLLDGTAPEEFHINQYEDHHDNIDDKLSDFKNIILKYLPDSCPSNSRNEILYDVFLFEDDLTKHTRIEERILTPLVKRMEAGYEQK